jgi:hypothetical protein
LATRLFNKVEFEAKTKAKVSGWNVRETKLKGVVDFCSNMNIDQV